MVNISDYELQKDGGYPSSQPGSAVRWVVIVALFVTALAAGWYVIQNRRQAAEPTPGAVESPAASADRALGGTAPAIELPPLGETDVLVRTLATSLSSHPLLASWLATDGVIRRFTVVVDNIAYGQPVRRQLTEVTPAGTFRVSGGGQLRTDPRSFERYAPLTAAMESIDAVRAAEMYSMLRPRIEEAYLELGRGVSFDRTLEQAIIALLHAPPIRGDEPLAPARTVGYAYSNPQLERLTPAQKHLLRMGPDRAPRVQTKLRDIALALGIPRDRLP
jgi:hypothetical protein